MVSFPELRSRIQEYFSFSRKELLPLVAAIFIMAFIFSFRDWGGEQLDVSLGVAHLFLALIIVAISFFIRFSWQKIYALSQGYRATVKVWWLGLIIALLVAFISLGRLPLVLIGTVAVAFLERQRLGEFRYGFSYEQNGRIAFWGIAANLVLAILFAVGLYFSPDSYFFSKGVLLNLAMAFFSLLPIPQLDGLAIFFGSRVLYGVALGMVLLAGVLLLTGTTLGLILAVVLASGAGIFLLLTRSGK